MTETRSTTFGSDRVASVQFAHVGDWAGAHAANPAQWPDPSEDASTVAEYIDRAQVSKFEAYTPNSEGPRTKWKDFEHYKRSFALTPSGMDGSLQKCYIATDAGVPYVPNQWLAELRAELPSPFTGFYLGEGYPGEYRPWAGLTELYDPTLESGTRFVRAPSNLDELKQNGFNTIMPFIKSELSLINSILELKDIASLKGSLEKVKSLGILGRIIATKKTALKYQLRHPLATLKEILQTSADLYLQWKFNVSPAIRDVLGIYKALAACERRINDLVSREGRTQNRHFTYVWQEMQPQSLHRNGYVLSGGNYYPSILVGGIDRLTYPGPTVFHIEIQYNYNFTEYQREHARVLALLDYFGVNLNPQIIWNAIPWSFVVDWFAGVGRWLSQFQIRNMAPLINIQRCLWSIKRERRITCDIEYLGSLQFPGGGYNRHSLPVVVETAYRRQTYMPEIGSVILSGLTPTEFSLGAALVITRKHKPKHRRLRT